MQQDNILRKTPELVISFDLNDDCAYHLTWETHCTFGDASKRVWVNAVTGDIVRSMDFDYHLNAPTEVYGTQMLNDKTSNGSTSLRSPLGDYSVYDFSNTSKSSIYTSNYLPSLIPSTTDTTWMESSIAPSVFQSFHVLDNVIPALKSIGLGFGHVHVGAGWSATNAKFIPEISTAENNYLAFGQNEGSSFALYDVVGHELGHAYINKYIDNKKSGTFTIHEAVADMIGTYAESVAQGNLTDWAIGDDANIIESFLNRDMASPPTNLDCYDELENADDGYENGAPMRLWFVNVVSGDTSGINGIGILKATKIVLDAVKLLNNFSDYEEMMAATLAVAKQNFGPCSAEYEAVRKSWQKICMDPGEDCYFEVTGTSLVCEESDYLQLSASGLPSADYRWYFPLEWTIVGTPNGNSWEGGPLFIVTDFPEYPYYPQYFTVKVVSYDNLSYEQTIHIKLEDCDHDDLTCEEYHGYSKPSNTISVNLPTPTNTFVSVVDLLGRLLFSGTEEEFEQNFVYSNLPKGVLIIFRDQEGAHIKTLKKI